MPSLIINADDLGAGPDTDLGIIESHLNGIVTSASLQVTGPSAPQAAEQALECSLPLGIHLNLSEGRSMMGEIAGLTNEHGHFLGKSHSRVALQTGDYFTAAVYSELACQIETALSWGVIPDHLDTHQHTFLFPGVTELVLQLAIEFKISAVRLPLPCALPGSKPDPELTAELDLYRRLAPRVQRAIKTCGLRSPAGLFGMDCLNRLDIERLSCLVSAFPERGHWELMVHPGRLDALNPFGGKEREIELCTLVNPCIRKLFADSNIQLTTFGDLPCAS